KRTIAPGFYLDTERFAFFLCEFCDGRPALRERFDPRIMDAGMLKRRQFVFNVLEVYQLPNGLCRGQPRQRLNVFRSSAKAGSFQKVCRQIVIPIGRADWSELILPLRNT